jgi:hypothetical protein
VKRRSASGEKWRQEKWDAEEERGRSGSRIARFRWVMMVVGDQVVGRTKPLKNLLCSDSGEKLI